MLSSDVPYAKRRKGDPESDQYLTRLDGNKAKCMFLLENDPDAGGETGLCAYEARSDMVRRHIRAVHLKLKYVASSNPTRLLFYVLVPKLVFHLPGTTYAGTVRGDSQARGHSRRMKPSSAYDPLTQVRPRQ